MLPISEGKKTFAPLHESDKCLISAFASFRQAAGSLEKYYEQLQVEVGRLRRELESANHALQVERENTRRAQAMVEVATVLAHEIRNPLASMELFTGLLADSGELGLDQQRLVCQLQAGLRTLTATVNNVLNFHSTPAASLMNVTLGDVIRTTLEFVDPLAKASGVAIEFFDDELGAAQVSGDAHMIQQVLLNLSMNSIHFMPQGGELKVMGRLLQEGRVVQVSVSDSGPGIPLGNRERVFEPGFTTRPGSPGLGLAVCRKIVQQHGGTIRVEPVSEGARLVLEFEAL